jgi:hypothetical protein
MNLSQGFADTILLAILPPNPVRTKANTGNEDCNQTACQRRSPDGSTLCRFRVDERSGTEFGAHRCDNSSAPIVDGFFARIVSSSREIGAGFVDVFDSLPGGFMDGI